MVHFSQGLQSWPGVCHLRARRRVVQAPLGPGFAHTPPIPILAGFVAARSLRCWWPPWRRPKSVPPPATPALAGTSSNPIQLHRLQVNPRRRRRQPAVVMCRHRWSRRLANGPPGAAVLQLHRLRPARTTMPPGFRRPCAIRFMPNPPAGRDTPSSSCGWTMPLRPPGSLAAGCKAWRSRWIPYCRAAAA